MYYKINTRFNGTYCYFDTLNLYKNIYLTLPNEQKKSTRSYSSGFISDAIA